MEGIYQWIRSLVFYLILMTMLMNLLPDKKYENYLRLFTGVVFLLLFFQPFTGLLGARERIAGLFERLTFQNEVQLLRKELQSVDGERIGRMMDGYQSAVENDLRVMAEHCRSAKISVAGGIKPETVPEYAALKPEVLIVGSGITHAADPKEAARQIKESMEKSIGGGR